MKILLGILMISGIKERTEKTANEKNIFISSEASRWITTIFGRGLFSLHLFFSTASDESPNQVE